jgi:uncharacterized protein
MTPHRGGNGLLVARNARHDCDTGDLPTIELGNPAIRETLCRSRIVPAEPVQYCFGPVRFGQSGKAGRQQLEKSAGKEMTMSIANAHGEQPIIIGLVSDTHGLVRSGLFRALGGVSQILHAGDVGGRDVLDMLRSIAPVQAVYGNVDPIDGVLPDEIVTEVGGLSIHVSHGHELGSPTPAKLLSRYSADVLVFGHTHHALVERSGKRLVINPGAAGPKRFDVKPSVAILRVANGTAQVEIVPLMDS